MSRTPEENRAYMADYREKNAIKTRDQGNAAMRRYRTKNPEKALASSLAATAKCSAKPDYVRPAYVPVVKTDIDVIRANNNARSQAYRDRHPERARESRRNSDKKRRSSVTYVAPKKKPVVAREIPLVPRDIDTTKPVNARLELLRARFYATAAARKSADT